MRNCIFLSLSFLLLLLFSRSLSLSFLTRGEAILRFFFSTVRLPSLFISAHAKNNNAAVFFLITKFFPIPIREEKAIESLLCCNNCRGILKKNISFVAFSTKKVFSLQAFKGGFCVFFFFLSFFHLSAHKGG